MGARFCLRKMARISACTIPIWMFAAPFTADEDRADPNIVKVVTDRAGRALYFSRAPLALGHKHLGLYAYRRAFLDEYVDLEPTPLEQAERLEQLRVLEHGHRIAVGFTRSHSHGIDTPEQYEAFVRRWQDREAAQ